MDELKLSYSNSLKRVKVTLSAELCQEDKKPPKSLLKRAKDKLESEKKKGTIEAYEIYEDELNHVWASLRSKVGVSQSKEIEVIIAQGARVYQGIEIGESQDGNFFITINLSGEKLSKISWNVFYFNVRQLLRKRGIKKPPHEAMLKGAYLKARGNKHVHHYLIKTQPRLSDQTEKGMSVAYNKGHAEAYLYIFDEQLLRDESNLREVMRRSRAAFQTLHKQHPSLRLLQEELKAGLRDVSHGPEFLGIGLPRAFLLAARNFERPAGAVGQTGANHHSIPARKMARQAQPLKLARKQGSGAQATATGKKAPPPMQKAEGKRLFEFEVSEDRMEARIKNVNEKLMQSPNFKPSNSSIISELQSDGIVFGYELFLEKIVKSLTMEANVKGQIIACGRPAETGSDCYLHPIYLDGSISSQEALMQDINKEPKQAVVKPGTLIAEVRYRDGVLGKDVYGEQTAAEYTDDIFEVNIGDGVEEVEKGRYKATTEGMPLISGHKISISPVKVIKGDVNPVLGDVHFRGSAEIHGNIENGARVVVTGDLIVKGSIAKAYVKSGGNLIVEGGINSSQTGWVESGGNLFAGFIENSRITVHQNLTVRGSVLNSNIIVGDTLQIVDRVEGTIAGGIISVRNTLKAGKLGYTDGKQTVCRVGADWINERRKSIIESRIQKLQAASQHSQKIVDELKSKKTKTPEQQDSFTLNKKRVSRLGLIIRKNERRLTSSTKNIIWNKNSYLIVENILARNVDITVGGRPIPVSSDMRAVLITYQKFRDGRINPLEFLDEFLGERNEEDEEMAS